MSLVWFILIIGISIFVHELGHYWAAKAQKVGVKTFAIGFGPKIFGFRRWDTDWRLNWIPLGGYAEIDGMMPGENHGYNALRIPGKLLVLVGGVVMNFLLAWGLMGLLFSTQGFPQADPSRIQVIRVVEGSLAQSVGLKAGDVIVAIDGKPVQDPSDLAKIREATGTYNLQLVREGETLNLNLLWDGSQERIGVEYNAVVTNQRLPFFQGAFEGIQLTIQMVPRMVSALVGGIGQTLSGQGSGELVGPVGIVSATGQAAQQGVWGLVSLMALINVSLAVFNLLPIPGLDGGRILLTLVGGVAVLFGRRLRPEQEASVNYFGFLFLLLLFVLITFQDIRRLIGG